MIKASLWRRAAFTLVAGAALAFPMTAKADLLGGLSLRAGMFVPQHEGARNVLDFAAWGGGIEYKVPWVPRLLNGEHWSTSISVDFHYSERKAGIVRYLPVSINQIYTFEEQNGRTPYAGFCITAATFGSTGTGTVYQPGNNIQAGGSGQPTVTRFGGGVILGMNLNKSLYLEGRYEWIDRHNVSASPEGFRGYIGFRF